MACVCTVAAETEMKGARAAGPACTAGPIKGREPGEAGKARAARGEICMGGGMGGWLSMRVLTKWGSSGAWGVGGRNTRRISMTRVVAEGRAAGGTDACCAFLWEERNPETHGLQGGNAALVACCARVQRTSTARPAAGAPPAEQACGAPPAPALGCASSCPQWPAGLGGLALVGRRLTAVGLGEEINRCFHGHGCSSGWSPVQRGGRGRQGRVSFG